MWASNIDGLCRILKEHYSGIKPFLDYKNHFELLIGVILTAQTTDAQVNRITPELFRRFPNAVSLAEAPLEELEEIIRSTGFFRVKAKNIRECARVLLEKYQGHIPESIEELIQLPGVGRKSANVVIGHAFDKPAIAVDTHFSRVAGRLGLCKSKSPAGIEKEVKALIPPAKQMLVSQSLNAHGREICKARNPRCEECFLKSGCPGAFSFLNTYVQ